MFTLRVGIYMKKMSLKSIGARVILVGLLIFVPELPAKKSGGKRWIVDKIVARVNGVNVLKSDLEKPQIGKEGGVYTLGELISEELIFQRAQEKKMLPSAADVDRQIVSFKMQLNLNTASNDEFEQHLKQYGFTFNTYRNQIGRLLAVNNTKQAEISEKILVTSQEVEDFYHRNPAHVKERFNLQMALLDEEHVDNYTSYLENSDVSWKEFGFVQADEIDERYAVATQLSVGEMTPPIKVNNKYVVIKLVAKEDAKLLSLSDRYSEIEKELQYEKRSNFVKSFEKDLLAKAFIYYP